MRTTTILMYAFAMASVLHCDLPAREYRACIGNATVNPVIGDRSFIATFGRSPSAADPEHLRVATHLAYVERLLRARDMGHLSPALRAERLRNLDRLHYYHQRGLFPRNENYPGRRRPCFIDGDGTICAVGYLVEQSEGRDMAERINSDFQYATIREMNSPELAQWVATSGLTLEEAAMIQPAYYTAPSLYAGISAGITSPVHSGMDVPRPLQGRVDPAGTSFGLNPYAALHGTWFFNNNREWQHGIMGRISYDGRSIDIEGTARDLVYTDDNGNTRTMEAYYAIEVDYSLLSTSILWTQRVHRSRMLLLAGPTIGIPLEQRRRDAQIPTMGFAAAYESPARFTPVQFGVEAGVQYELGTSYRARLVPTLTYSLTLTNMREGDPWRVDAFKLGMDIQLPLNGGE